LSEARQGLIRRQLLLYRRPMYQLLALPPRAVAAGSECPTGTGRGPTDGSAPPAPHRRYADAEEVSIGEVLRRCWPLRGDPR
jgi:hypothetical protein